MRKWAALLVAASLLTGCSRNRPEAPAPPAAVLPGTISKTVDAAVPDRKDPPWIQTVAFATADHGWIVFGDGAGALETTDGGRSWQPATLPQLFLQMDFYSPTSGFADTYRTTDGGATWQPTDTSAWPYAWPTFIDDRHAWAMSDQFYATADGGATWVTVAHPCGAEKNRPFSFISETTGWVLCGWDGRAGGMSKRLFRTDDGGKSWTLLGEAVLGPAPGPEDDKEWPGGLSIADYSGDILFTDERHGWFTGVRYGSLLTTADGGRTWAPRQSPVRAGGRLVFPDARHGYLWGYGVGGNVVAATRDGGETWQQVYPVRRPRELFYLDARTYIGALDSTLYRSVDAGGTWQQLAQFADGEVPIAVAYTTASQAWALTAAGEHHRLYASADGGASWAPASAGTSLDSYYELRAVDAQVAILWDGAGRLLVTRDGGASFQAAAAPPDQFGGHGFDFRTADQAWFSRGFLLYRTEFGPGQWQSVPLQAQQKAQGVALMPDGRVWALVVDTSNAYTPVGMLLASADAGKTWTRYTLGTFNQPNGISRCGLSSLCVNSGGGGPGIVSHDGGLTWAYRN